MILTSFGISMPWNLFGSSDYDSYMLKYSVLSDSSDF